jgi:peptidoglycan/xylan/chitin deacetylase (PgdA/CDA1 family)
VSASTPSHTSFDPAFFLHERYRDHRSGASLRLGYYALKPYVPRSLQLRLRRAYARRRGRPSFPDWPIEPVLVEHQRAEFRRRLDREPSGRVPFVNFWPEGKRFAVILTHDVEGPRGLDNIGRVLEIEQRYGLVSSWNFVAEWYPIREGLFEELREAGCEIGLHGIRHDGRLFQNRDTFARSLPDIARYAAQWEAVGFRSPATHRNADWMAELPMLYDSSFPDTDPFEPQPGGCCSIFPFRFGDVVELPITLVQDHTLWEILGDRTIDAWVHKSDWIMRNHGLINLIVHPDYVVDPARLALYERFLAFLARQSERWHVLPRDAAEWWRQREKLSIGFNAEGAPTVVGDSDFQPTVAHAVERAREIVFDV